MDINLHIERLVLDGIDVTSRQGEEIQAKVSSELTHLLSSSGIAPDLVNGAHLRSVSAPGIQMTDTKPQALGQQIANSVYGGIGHE